MPLQGSGNPISIKDIKDEFGPNPGNTIGPVSMEDYRLQEEDIDGLTNLPLDENAGPNNNTDIPRSGQMSFENFYNAKLNVVVRMTSSTVPGNNPSQQNARNIYDNNTNASVVRCVGNLRTRPSAGDMGGRRVIIDVNKTISGGGAPISKPSISDGYTEEMLKPFLKNSENITEQSRIAKQYGVDTWKKLRNIAESR